MFCKYCGGENKEDAIFCKHCGKSIVQVNVNNEVKESLRNIEKKMFVCPNCGALPVSEESRFCKKCGTEFDRFFDTSTEKYEDKNVSTTPFKPEKKADNLDFHKNTGREDYEIEKNPFPKRFIIIPLAIFIVSAIIIAIVFIIKETLSKDEDIVSDIPVSSEIPTITPTPQEFDDKTKDLEKESEEKKDSLEENPLNSMDNLIYEEFITDQIKVDDKTFSEIYQDILEVETPSCYLYDITGDGKDELIVDGIYYGLDVYCIGENKLYRLAGGSGTAEICNIYKGNENVYVGLSDMTHKGRQILELLLFNSDGRAVEDINIKAEYYDSDSDEYDENSDFSFNGQSITMTEYENLMETYTRISTDEMRKFSVEKTDNDTAYTGDTLNSDIIDAFERYYSSSFPTSGDESYSVKFAYLDEDNIPELLVKPNFDAETITILQYSDGKIYDLGAFSELSYKPQKNDIVESWCDGETSETRKRYIEGHGLSSLGGMSTSYSDDGQIKYYQIGIDDSKIETTKTEYDKFFVKIASRVYTSLNSEEFFTSIEEASKDL